MHASPVQTGNYAAAICKITTLLLLLTSCQHLRSGQAQFAAGSRSRDNGPGLVAINFSNPADPIPAEAPIQIAGAKNEWTSFVVQLRNLPAPSEIANWTVRIQPPPGIPLSDFSVYQILSMPVDTNRAGYVRHTGLPIGAARLPRALLPLTGKNGAIALAALRDPAHPFDPGSRAGGLSAQPVLLWIDLHIPAQIPAGDYSGAYNLQSESHPISQIPISLHIYDFAIPVDPHLTMLSRIDWQSLEQLYPDQFEAITPRLMNRSDSIYTPAIQTLDQLVDLARQNRVEAVVPRLQPTVKWPAGQAPQVDWSDFDSVVSPWLNGDGFTDQHPLAFWPLPKIDFLNNFDDRDRQAYWAEAATHFNSNDWLARSSAFIDAHADAFADDAQASRLSAVAQLILDAHPLIRVTVPLQDDQLRFADAQNNSLLDPHNCDRLMSAATGIVFAAPKLSWSPDVISPDHWLRTDVPGLLPYVGAGGDQRDVRLWAWLAFLKHASLILWNNPLPQHDDPNRLADPGEMVWFYPGRWFGVDQPVPSIQLKWLRRAEQDYEYLYLAQQRGMSTNAFMLARLMIKPVQIQPDQPPDPEYSLLTGTVDQGTWDEAQSLLARTILIGVPGTNPDDPDYRSKLVALNLDTIRWQQPKERPYIMPRVAQWLWETPEQQGADERVFVRLGVDIYNAGDNRPTDNLLQWDSASPGWEFQPQPFVIGSLQTYWVQRFSLEARVDLENLSPDSYQPVELSFVDGYTRDEYRSQAVLPIAVSDRREGRLTIDGNLDDWDPSYEIHSGQLTKMLDRPAVQARKIEPAQTSSTLFSGWGEDNFYLAFHVQGCAAGQPLHRNFIESQFRRAWGEDVCEFLIQPIYDDNTTGPVTYVACKPNGVCVVSQTRDVGGQKSDSGPQTDTAVRYAANPQNGTWDGELAIPWSTLIGPDRARPRLLRFNFIQHRSTTGESDSWAGPIDFDRDDQLMGLLYLRDTAPPGMPQTPP